MMARDGGGGDSRKAGLMFDPACNTPEIAKLGRFEKTTK
jgi:hypothetical protein